MLWHIVYIYMTAISPKSRKCHNHRPTHDTARKRHRTITVTQQQANNLIKASSSLILSEMIAKLEEDIKYYIIKQGTKHKNLTNNGSSVKKQLDCSRWCTISNSCFLTLYKILPCTLNTKLPLNLQRLKLLHSTTRV